MLCPLKEDTFPFVYEPWVYLHFSSLAELARLITLISPLIPSMMMLGFVSISPSVDQPPYWSWSSSGKPAVPSFVYALLVVNYQFITIECNYIMSYFVFSYFKKVERSYMLHDFIDDILKLRASSPKLSSVYIPIFVEPSLFQF